MLNTQNTSPIGLYRTGLTSPERRNNMTVGRVAILQDSLQILRRAIGKPPKHHCLFIAPRGFGKTHLLSLIEDEVRANELLNKAYHVIRFPEEANRLLSFGDFILGICEILKDTLPNEPHWASLYAKLSIEERDEIIIDTLVPAIRNRRKATGQSIIIMIENLNQVFDQQLKDSRSVAALRGFLMEDNGCLLLATAPTHFDGILDNKQPFYDFFDIQILNQLTEEESFELIRKNLEWEKSPLLAQLDGMRHKLLALYRMTGGSPRLTIMLYELIAHEAVTEVKIQLHILLDRITPFYQDRLRDLSPQERAVLETIATMRRTPKTPGAIAERMRMKATQVSSLLNRLQKSHYLRSVDNPKDKRSRLYVISEGFFDIWLAMNVGRGERQRLPFLVDFFEQFYPLLEERQKIREKYRNDLKIGGTTKSTSTEALDFLSEVGSADEKAAEKIRMAAFSLRDGNGDLAESYLREAKAMPLHGMGQWILDRTDISNATDYLSEIEELISCWESHRDNDLEGFVEKLRNLGGPLNNTNWSMMKIQFLTDHVGLVKDDSERFDLQMQLGDLLIEQAQWAAAEQLFTTLGVDLEEKGQKQLLAHAILGLARVLYKTNRISESEQLLVSALGKSEKGLGPDHPDVAAYLNDLAQLYKNTGRLTEAEPLMVRALAIDEKHFGSEHLRVAIRLNNLAQLYFVTNRLADSADLLKRGLALLRRHLGAEHPLTQRILEILLLTFKALGQLDKAQAILNEFR
jgi:DNA-binding MarR family transcriptional regulator